MRKDKKVIGICVASMQSDSWEKHVRAICKEAGKRDYTVMIFNTFQRLYEVTKFGEGEVRVFDMIPFHKLGVLIVFSESIANDEISEQLVQKAKDAGVPVITIDRRMKGCHNVLFAYEESFEKVVRHVIEDHGCKKINFMAGFEHNEFSDARIGIFKKVLEQNDLVFEPERLAYGQFWEMPARHACEEWVAKWQRGEQSMPEAVICANDIMALTVMNVLTNHGICIPKDVIVTGFDGLELEQYCTPRLTTATDDVRQIGKSMLDIIDRCIENPTEEPKDLYIPFHTRFTESCGCEPIKSCNPNERIMQLYGYAAEMCQQSTDTFFMMTTLTDGYSAVEMGNKLKDYRKAIDAKYMMLFLDPSYYKETDIPTNHFEKDSYVLFTQLKDNVYDVPLEEVKKDEFIDKICWMAEKKEPLLFIPIHCQEENYGFMVTTYDYEGKDTRAFYEFVLGLDQVLGTIRRQSQLHRSYVTDALTGLYNRRGFYLRFEKKMKQLANQDKYLFMASVDMDGLKFINDTYGHAEGDFAIKRLAEILQEMVTDGHGICARFGGDEYMVVQLMEAEKIDHDFCDHFEQRLQDKIRQDNQKKKAVYELSASCGVIGRKIQNAEEIDTMMKETDEKMYQCKCRHHNSREARSRQKSM